MNPKEEGSDSSPERDDGNVWAEQLKVFESGHRNLQIDRWSSQKKEKKYEARRRRFSRSHILASHAPCKWTGKEI